MDYQYETLHHPGGVNEEMSKVTDYQPSSHEDFLVDHDNLLKEIERIRNITTLRTRVPDTRDTRSTTHINHHECDHCDCPFFETDIDMNCEYESLALPDEAHEEMIDAALCQSSFGSSSCEEPREFVGSDDLPEPFSRTLPITTEEEKSACRFTCMTNSCGKKFTCQKSLTQHIKIHSKKFCKECDRSFGSPHALNKHNQNVHLYFKCEKCKLPRFKSRINLQRHRAYSHTPKLYFCEQCNCPAFETGFDLKLHRLAQHQKFNLHSEQQVPRCASFAARGELESDNLFHLPEKNAPNPEPPAADTQHCNRCDRHFIAALNYERHVQNEHQKFKCPDCEYESLLYSDYTYHRTVAHLGRHKKCRLCDEAFTFKFHFTDHDENWHRSS